MTKWNDFLEDRDPSFKRKKAYTGGCKKNRIAKNKFGKCKFLNNECMYCHRPRKCVNKLDSKTNTIVTHYLE